MSVTKGSEVEFQALSGAREDRISKEFMVQGSLEGDMVKKNYIKESDMVWYLSAAVKLVGTPCAN